MPEKNWDSLNYEIINNEDNPEESMVIIYMEVEPKEKQNSLTLDLKENSLNGLAKVADFEFKLEPPYNMSPILGTTGEDGTLRFENIISLSKGEYIYKIVPKEGNVYGLETIRVAVTFNELGEITNVKKMSSNIESITYRDYEENDYYYNNYDIKVIAQLANASSNTQRITLKNVDSLDESILLGGVEYLLTIIDSTGSKTIVKNTDTFGEFSFDVYSDADCIVKIKQSKNKKGYVLNSTEKLLYLKHNSVDNKVYVDFTQTDPSLNIVENTDGTIDIKDLSLKKIKQAKPGNIDIYLYNLS